MNDIRLYENIAELSEQFPLKLRRYRTRQLYLHWHEHIELLHLLDGEGTFVVNGETVTGLIYGGTRIFARAMRRLRQTIHAGRRAYGV